MKRTLRKIKLGIRFLNILVIILVVLLVNGCVGSAARNEMTSLPKKNTSYYKSGSEVDHWFEYEYDSNGNIMKTITFYS